MNNLDDTYPVVWGWTYSMALFLCPHVGGGQCMRLFQPAPVHYFAQVRCERERKLLASTFVIADPTKHLVSYCYPEVWP